ncbi:MAG: cytochrome c oxidase accessory protein CcoG [Burkholderiaceae bacterium]|nr:cytochrome c oxidase accessory protein CcoG [Burkholderiaceae bacterium]
MRTDAPRRRAHDRGDGAGAGGAQAPTEVVISLYEKRPEIYPRARVGASLGRFQRWRWIFVWLTQFVFYAGPWFTWNGRQAVLFHLVQRKFYLFGLVLWPQDVIYLTGLLVISALSLFLFTAVAGRLWCGYACPQTVYTEIFMWIERRIEGDRAKRMALDRSAWTARKVALKGAKHAAWIAVGLWTGFTFVGFFTPIRELAAEALHLELGPWETFWILFYGFATYGNAGWMREQVCLYMCPYARFQSAMFDRDTLIITYDNARGEPRGAIGRSRDRRSRGLGDCVDCGFCMQVCPTGIDIRKGLQYECIGCAACIDACDYVMRKNELPVGLIRYTTMRALSSKQPARDVLSHVFRPRVVLYTVVVWGIIAAIGVSLALRVPLKVDVIRDRRALAREVEGERIENVYRLQVMNTSEQPHSYDVRAAGMAGLLIASSPRFDVGPEQTQTVVLRLQAPGASVPPGANRIELQVQAADDAAVAVREKTVFFGLRR